jgi:hypothetical protein
MVSKKELNNTYSKYKKITNMTYSQLLNWAKNPISQTASQQPNEESEKAKSERRNLLRNYVDKNKKSLFKSFNTAQIRNLVLQKTPKKDWDNFLVDQANKAISYLSRAKKIKGTINKRALKNWAFDRNK